MYGPSTSYYDLVYTAQKDYAAEARAVHGLLAARPNPVRRMLDVGCGSGEHDRHLAKWYEVSGVDINAGLVELASAKRPDADYRVADVLDLDLDASYDAVICLFSVLAYLPTVAALTAALRRMAAHLRPGGAIVVEPWHTPETWRPADSDRVERRARDGVRLQRTVRCSTVDGASVFRFSHQIWESGHHREFAETHVLSLFTTAELAAAFAGAGLVARHVPRPPFPRGLYLAHHKEAG